MLDVRRLQVLRAVVTSGTVTAAAAHLGYTPSAVSQQVAALEKQAGTELLERVGRGVRPTPAGLLLTEHAALISAAVAQAESALADLRAGRTGRVSIRYFATAGSSLVAPALARMRAEHPGVRVDLELTDPEDPSLDVMRGQADLAVVVRQDHGRPRDGIRVVHLLKDPYAAVLPASHPLARKPALHMHDLAGEQWVGSEPPGPCLEPVLDACAAAGFSPDFVVQSEDYATAQGFVAAGLGIGLMPRLGLRSPHPGVVLRPVCNPEPVRVISAVVRETSLEQAALRDLLDALRDASAAATPRNEAGAESPMVPSADGSAAERAQGPDIQSLGAQGVDAHGVDAQGLGREPEGEGPRAVGT